MNGFLKDIALNSSNSLLSLDTLNPSDPVVEQSMKEMLSLMLNI